jgi:hypothetical protein
MIDGEAREDLAAVVRPAEPSSVLQYTLGADVLRWEPAPTDSGTRLTLRHTVEHADVVPKVAAGWHICLAVAERLLDGERLGPIVGEDARNLRLGRAARRVRGAPRRRRRAAGLDT